MSPLPLSSAPCLCYFSANSGFVQVSSANATATVTSMLDEVSGLGATAAIATAPTFNGGGLGGYADLAFGGSAYLSFNSLATKVGQSLTLFVVASVATPASGEQDLITFGTSTSAVDGYLRLGVTTAYGFSAHNTAGTGPNFTSGGIADAKVHLYTLIKDDGAGTLSLRVDGVQVATASCTGAVTYDRFTLGAFSANGSISNQLTGEISEVAVFNAAGSYLAVEDYLLLKYGLGSATNDPLTAVHA